jgi:hypothetical protein
MTPLQTALVELWGPSVERLKDQAARASGISIVQAGVVDDSNELFVFGICCESDRVTESDVTFSLAVTCIHLDPAGDAKVRATVGWHRAMVNYKDNRHPGYSIWVRESPCFAYSANGKPDDMKAWVKRMELATRSCISRGKPPGSASTLVRRLLGFSRGRQELPL